MAEISQKPSQAGWQVVERRLLIDNQPFARVYAEDLRLPGGELITDWTRVELPPFVIIFAMLGDGRVAFVRQYRQAVGAYTLELPAGHINDGEDALTAARRELREEAGLEAANWQFLGKYVMDANHECGWAYVYLVRDAWQTAAPNHGDLGEMTVHWLELDEVRQRWMNGELVSAPTALSVGLALHRVAE